MLANIQTIKMHFRGFKRFRGWLMGLMMVYSVQPHSCFSLALARNLSANIKGNFLIWILFVANIKWKRSLKCWCWCVNYRMGKEAISMSELFRANGVFFFGEFSMRNFSITRLHGCRPYRFSWQQKKSVESAWVPPSTFLSISAQKSLLKLEGNSVTYTQKFLNLF